MSNATIPWQLLQLDPDTDAPKLMQNFEALQDWLLVEAIHRHHLQFGTADIGVVTAASSKALGAQTFLQPFPSGVVPNIQVTTNVVAGPPAQTVRLTSIAHAITNTGFSLNVFNNAASDTGSGAYAAWVALDPTFDVSL